MSCGINKIPKKLQVCRGDSTLSCRAEHWSWDLMGRLCGVNSIYRSRNETESSQTCHEGSNQAQRKRVRNRKRLTVNNIHRLQPFMPARKRATIWTRDIILETRIGRGHHKKTPALLLWHWDAKLHPSFHTPGCHLGKRCSLYCCITGQPVCSSIKQ